MTPLIHLIYASEAAVDFSDDAVRTLLVRARANNERIGVTGILLLVDRSFFQVLEGDPDAVVPLYQSIASDKRHKRAVKLLQEPIEQRDFTDWSMGLARATRKDLAAIPGLSDFFANDRALNGLGDGMARKLLTAFREGRWRARVET